MGGDISPGAVAALCPTFAVLFGVVTVGAWLAVRQWHPRAARQAPMNEPHGEGAVFSWGDEADVASRTASTLHCAVLLPWLVGAMASQRWDWDTFTVAEGSTAVPLQAALCYSFGYFVADLVTMVVGRGPLWYVFAIHHVAAAVPIGHTLFFPSCRHGTSLLIGLFLLVEVATVPFNINRYLDEVGFTDATCPNRASFAATVVLWLPSRVALPVVLDYYMLKRVVLPLPPSDRLCLIPSVVGAFYITAFCAAVMCLLAFQSVRRCLHPRPVVE